MSAFDGIKEPVQSYVDIWTPMFKQASESGLVPDFLLHWGHGAAIASVLLSMGVIGAYMGWQIRLGNGEEVTPLTLGETIREAHPKSKLHLKVPFAYLVLATHHITLFNICSHWWCVLLLPSWRSRWPCPT